MKKIIIGVVIGIVFSTTILYAEQLNAVIGYITNFNIFIDGTEAKFDNDVVVINDTTYIPLRDVAEALDNSVEWEGDKQRILIKKNKDSRELFPFQEGKLYGYIDKYGKVVIEPQFEYAGDFSDGLACVGKKKDRDWGMSGLSTMVYGYINTAGELVIPYANERERDFHDGLVAAWEYDSDNKAYFMDKQGKNVLNKYYYDVKDFSDGYAAVLLNDTAKNPHRNPPDEPQQWTFINADGKECGMTFTSAKSFVNGVSVVEKDGKTYAINTSFEPIFESKYTLVSCAGSNCYIAKDLINDKFGVVNENDDIIIDFVYDYIHYSDGMYRVGIGQIGALTTIYGIINKYGETIIEPKASISVSDFHYGLAVVAEKNGDKFSIINKNGKTILTFEDCYSVCPVSENLIVCWKKITDKFYMEYVDIHGNVLINNEIQY